tara:strand:+ start:413 stop:733 length:321 start_codon:yes stop_codon:yes gene_type:complete
MKATELRIGNWVMYSSKIQVNENKIRECVDHPDRFAPIPLTEDWLKRFGFEYSDLNGDSGLWKIPPFQIYGKYNQFIYEYALDVNYVHQLQNLYFALTGQELNQNN